MSGAMHDHRARQIMAGLDSLRVGNTASVSWLALIARGGTPCPDPGGSCCGGAADRGSALRHHGRYYWLLLAESHLTRRLFANILGRIAKLPLPSG